MNREILFRGKRIDNGEWVYGYLRAFDDGSYHITTKVERNVARHIHGKPFYTLYGVEHEVDPKTVGQYTGLKDKNGVRIFEGDILTCGTEGFTICIEWSNGYKRYVAVVPSVHNVHVDLYKFIPALPCMVIGNRWDNPEFLEVLEDEV